MHKAHPQIPLSNRSEPSVQRRSTVLKNKVYNLGFFAPKSTGHSRLFVYNAYKLYNIHNTYYTLSLSINIRSNRSSCIIYRIRLFSYVLRFWFGLWPAGPGPNLRTWTGDSVCDSTLRIKARHVKKEPCWDSESNRVNILNIIIDFTHQQ